MPMAEGYSPVGAVVGATWPHELERLRKRMPNAWILLPGVGAQGGKVEDLVSAFDPSLIPISEPTRLRLIPYAVFCL